MISKLRPNKGELEFLNLAYDRFYSIHKEVFDDNFWEKDDWYRFSKIKDAFAVYSELLKYEPILRVISYIKQKRPPMEGEIGSSLFKFIRNIILHFPFYESWNSVCFTNLLINWSKEKQFIDRFLEKYKGRDPVKYRFWEAEKREMTYISINFPKEYEGDIKIYLKDILTEKEGVRFCLILMKQILDTQVEEMKE